MSVWKRLSFGLLVFALGLITIGTGARRSAGQQAPASAPAPPPATQPTARSRAALEAEFERMLSGAVLSGTWQMTGGQAGGAGAAAWSPPREERYEIARAEKDDAEHWIITARIQFADKDVTLPVRVRVVWADDTPIITLDELTLPLLGTYSARVMMYRGFYAGTWFGPDYAGIMSGRILRADNERAPTSQPASAPR